MVKVRLKTGEIKEVTKNIAHGLVERGEAVLLTGAYQTKPMSARGKKYKTK